MAIRMNGIVNNDEYMIPAVTDVMAATTELLVKASSSIPKL